MLMHLGGPLTTICEDTQTMAACNSIKCCTKCGESKPISEFNLERGKPRAYCKICHRIAVCEWQRNNRKRVNERVQRWLDKKDPNRRRLTPAMPENERLSRRKIAREKWRALNKEKMNECRRRWAEKNPHSSAARVRQYQAAKLNARPQWADKKKIAWFYKEAKRISAETGVQHEVDHIVPLVSEIVCGLHCENNLRVITTAENRTKSNKLIEV